MAVVVALQCLTTQPQADTLVRIAARQLRVEVNRCLFANNLKPWPVFDWKREVRLFQRMARWHLKQSTAMAAFGARRILAE
jgi:hypothetical protein